VNLYFHSKKEECTLAITVATTSPQRIKIILKDADKPHTVYTDRENTVKGKTTFYIRLPQSPDKSLVQIYNVKNGNMKKPADDKSFGIIKLEKQKLERKFAVNRLSNTSYGFVKFAQWFCENAGILSAGKSVYISDNNRFRIDYVDIIRDRETGKPKNTPARISQTTGIIEISKFHFQKYTVPMRMAILLHEFAHFYLNKDKRNETEADLNALMIYLGLGYPRIEAHHAFLKVFINSPSDQNVKRHQVLTSFIDNFEKMDIKLL